MVLKELKRKAVEQFIEMFNADKSRCSGVTINDVFHINICTLELEDDCIYLKRQVIDNSVIIVGCLQVKDLCTMDYLTKELNIVSFDNIEL